MSPSSTHKRQAGSGGRLCCAILLVLSAYVTDGAGGLDGSLLGLMLPEGAAVVDQTEDGLERVGHATLHIFDPACLPLPPPTPGIPRLALRPPPGRLAPPQGAGTGPFRPRAHLAPQRTHSPSPAADPA